MSEPQIFMKPTAVERLFNQAFGLLVRLGIGLPHNYLLEVRGGKTGRVYGTPVDVLDLGRRRFLVSGRGQTQWVRNAQAAGQAALARGRRRMNFKLRSLADAEKPPILKAYLDRFKLTVQRYFPIAAGSPVADFEPLVGRYPVFELVSDAGGTAS
jgi:deazaflavin-dependent oxidoreductase (nitroreductase family)